MEIAVLETCTQCSDEEATVEVCDHWLRNHMGQPTWREVAKALIHVGFQQLATDIKKVYEIGMMKTGMKNIILTC